MTPASSGCRSRRITPPSPTIHTALSGAIREQVFPNARFKGDANLLIMPTLDAANISFNLLKVSAADGVTIGPMLLGCSKPVHILTPTASVRRFGEAVMTERGVRHGQINIVPVSLEESHSHAAHPHGAAVGHMHIIPET